MLGTRRSVCLGRRELHSGRDLPARLEGPHLSGRGFRSSTTKNGGAADTSTSLPFIGKRVVGPFPPSSWRAGGVLGYKGLVC